MCLSVILSREAISSLYYYLFTQMTLTNLRKKSMPHIQVTIGVKKKYHTHYNTYYFYSILDILSNPFPSFNKMIPHFIFILQELRKLCNIGYPSPGAMSSMHVLHGKILLQWRVLVTLIILPQQGYQSHHIMDVCQLSDTIPKIQS